MQTHKHITDKDVGIRLDHFLVEHLTNQSRSFIKQLIQQGHVSVNERVVKAGYILKKDDVITYTIPDPETIELSPIAMNLEIIYEDDAIAVINKPQGLVVHPSSTFKGHTLVHGLLEQLNTLSSINGTIRPGIVHRIDKDTSGLLVIAKHDQAHRKLSEAIQAHEVKRKYQALVHGTFKKDKVTIDLPIGRHPDKRQQMAVVREGRHAITHVQVKTYYDKYSLLDVELETGRTHQIRVHLSHIGYPIVGDPTYGIKKEAFGQLLHAYELELTHPMTGMRMTFHADLPEHFKMYLNSLTVL